MQGLQLEVTLSVAALRIRNVDAILACGLRKGVGKLFNPFNSEADSEYLVDSEQLNLVALLLLGMPQPCNLEAAPHLCFK